MKSRILLPAIFSFLLLTCSLYAQQANDLTIVKVIPTGDTYVVNLELEGEVSVEYWHKDYIRVEISIQSNVHSLATLKHLCVQGRYHLVSLNDAFGLTITMPDLQKEVTINNTVFKDELSFKVFAPVGIKVNTQNTAQAMVTTAK